MIPVCSPVFNGNEKRYLYDAINEREVSGSGKFVRRFEEAFAKWAGTKYAVAVCNGFAALVTAIYGVDIKDNIAVPNNTIISCAIAAILNGLKVALYETPDQFAEMLHTNLMRCHLFGCFQESIGENIIDDCSQYWIPFTPRNVACYSLYANKLITSGEGGICITNDPKTYKRMKSYIDLCHSEERFVHRDIGRNFRMSNLQAAVALAQLEQIDNFIEKKQKIGAWYSNYLPLKATPKFGMEVPWMFLIKTEKNAGKMVLSLKKQGIECRRYFYPLHRQPCFKKHNYPYELFPYSNEMWDHAFYLPSGVSLTEKDVIKICKVLSDTLSITT